MNELRLLRQKKLKRLIDEVSEGNIADFARKIGKEPSYVARMLYPSDKAGAKPIGEKMALHICHKFVLPLIGLIEMMTANLFKSTMVRKIISS